MSRWRHHPATKVGRHPSGLSARENRANRSRRQADDDSQAHVADRGRGCWCDLPGCAGLGQHRLVSRSAQRASAPGAYRAGNSGGPMGQGQSLAAPAHPLVQRQTRGGATGDRKSWSTHGGCGPRRLEHTRQEDARGPDPPPAGVSASAAPAGLHPEEHGQETPVEHRHDAGSGHADPLPAGTESRRRGHGRPELVRVPARTIDRRCDRAMLYRSGSSQLGVVGARRRSPSLLRYAQPCLVDSPCSDGQGAPPEMADGGILGTRRPASDGGEQPREARSPPSWRTWP